MTHRLCLVINYTSPWGKEASEPFNHLKLSPLIQARLWGYCTHIHSFKWSWIYKQGVKKIMLQFHWKKIGVCKHQSGITKILGTVPSCPMRPKYPHSPVLCKTVACLRLYYVTIISKWHFMFVGIHTFLWSKMTSKQMIRVCLYVIVVAVTAVNSQQGLFVQMLSVYSQTVNLSKIDRLSSLLHLLPL